MQSLSQSNYIYPMNNQELLDAIKKRRQKIGGVEEPEEKKEKAKTPVKKISDNAGFMENKKNLQAFFAKGKQEETTHVEKEEIKGNKDGFLAAKQLLEKGTGGGGGLGTLPPPPPSLGLPNLPPPPPPPSLGNLPLPPPPSLSSVLPPPPSLSAVLPPPPSLNAVLPPPPSLNTVLPPPPSNTAQKEQKVNLPPPPQNTQKHTQPKTQKVNLPPPPQQYQPPPQQYQPPPQQYQPPPQQYQPPPQQYQPPPQQYQPPPQQYQPPQQQYQPPQQQKPNITFNQQPPQQQPQQPQRQVEPQSLFILGNNSNSNPQTVRQPTVMPPITAMDPQTIKKSQKKHKIFDRSSSKAYPLTTQFFKKDLAGFIKRQFIRQSNIIDLIDIRVTKSIMSYNFPSIQLKHRAVQPIDTLYADVERLDLVSCYMQKNITAGKAFNQARDRFLQTQKNYDWNSDKLKLKQALDAAQPIPAVIYRQPNFVQAKNMLIRGDNLMQQYAKATEYEKCTSIKTLKVTLQKYLQQYSKYPQKNEGLLDQIEELIAKLKSQA